MGERFVTHPDVRKICFTGSTAVGQADHARRGRPGQAGHPRARRQERQHRLRRLRPRDGCGTSSLRRLRQRRSGLLRPQPDPRRSAASSTGSWSSSRRQCRGVVVTDPRDEAAEMGPLISAGQRETGCGPTSRSRPEQVDVAFRGEGPDGAGYWYPPTVVLPALDDRPRLAGGGLRPGRRGDALRRRGRRGRQGQRHGIRALGLDLDARHRARRCGSRAASRPATCRSTRTAACATRHPSVASSRAASGASSGPTRSTRSPRSRTSSSPRN